MRLAPLRRLRARDALSDEEMVGFQRTNLIDSNSPNPSVETLLHAFLPHKFIDHTHSTAVLSVTDQPDCAAICRDVFGRRMGLVPYIMPGFGLAKKAAEVFEQDPAVEGLILLKHGIFTFGETAREAYERMIAMVTLAEERVASGRKTVFAARALTERLAAPEEVAPILRGACSIPNPAIAGAYTRFVLDFRTGPAILDYVNGAELPRYSQSGVATPDHTIRTKNYPLLVPPPDAGALDRFKQEVGAAVAKFAADYHAYFARQNARLGHVKRELDPVPRVVLVPGLGLFGLGRSAEGRADRRRSRREHDRDGGRRRGDRPLRIDPRARSLRDRILVARAGKARQGRGKAARRPGRARHRRRRHDRRGDGAALRPQRARRSSCSTATRRRRKAVAKSIGGAARQSPATSPTPQSVRAAFDAVCRRFGGLDIVVSNAGAAWQGKIGEVDEAVLRAELRAQFLRASDGGAERRARDAGAGHRRRAAVQRLETGGQSRRRFRPLWPAQGGRRLFLMRQYALDYGADGIRANAVNADRIRSGLLTPEMIRSALEGARRRRGRLYGAAIFCAARSPPRTWRRPSCTMRWRSRPRPTSPPSTAATSTRSCAERAVYPLWQSGPAVSTVVQRSFAVTAG